MTEEIKANEIRDAVNAGGIKLKLPKKKRAKKEPKQELKLEQLEQSNEKEPPKSVKTKEQPAEKKERKKYTPKEFSVIGEITDIKKKTLYENPEKKWKPIDPYYWQILLTNHHPQEYRVINAFKSQLEGDKEWPAEKIWKLLDTQAFRAYHGKKFNMIFIKYQRYINLLRWQVVS